MVYVQTDQPDREVQYHICLKNKALLTGASLETAKVQISDRFGEPNVSIKFNSQGASDFDRITAENVRKRLAIVLDGVVHSAPVIQERISGGQAQITGNFTMDEARDLAIVLRAGALPAPVNILEERTVGPSLGSDSIRQGIMATIIGSLLVILFMMFLLPAFGNSRGFGSHYQYRFGFGYIGCFQRHADFARHRRFAAYCRYGC